MTDMIAVMVALGMFLGLLVLVMGTFCSVRDNWAARKRIKG